MLLIPIAWQVAIRLIWHPASPFAAEDLHQILRYGPSFAFSVLDTAISQTIGDTHLTAALLVAIVLGTVALLSPKQFRPRTPWTTEIAGALALTLILTMLLLIVGRLSRGVELSSAGGYSYLILTTLLPLSGILLGHLARSRVSQAAVLIAFIALSLIGLATIADSARDLAAWKLAEERLMVTAAAHLTSHLEVYPEQVPVPVTAPMVSQEQIRLWTASGQLDARNTGQMESAGSLNMQWRIGSSSSPSGECQDAGPGQTVDIPVGANTDSARTAWVRCRPSVPESQAVRRFLLPAGVVLLESLARRPARLTVN